MPKTENWTKWDIYSRDDRATKWYLKHFKDKVRAYGIFIWLVEEMYKTNDGWIELDEIFFDSFCHDTGIKQKDLELAVNTLKDSKLFYAKDNKLTSKRVQREIANRLQLKEARSFAGKKGAMIKHGYDHLPSTCQANGGKITDQIRSDQIRVDQREREGAPCPTVGHSHSLSGDFLKFEEKLESTDGTKEWEFEKAFTHFQRRPMKDYPEIFLNPKELMAIVGKLRIDIPDNKLWKEVFEDIQAECRTQILKGRKPWQINAFGYFNKFGIPNALIKRRLKARS